MNNTDIQIAEQDKNVLNTFKKFLGLEHFGWKFGAVMLLICSILMPIIGIIMLTAGAAVQNASQPTYTGGVPGYPFVLMGVMYLVLTAVELIPCTVVSFIMLKKNEYYQSTIDTDISIARKRATSVGMIVFCFIFNTLAAVFYLINFIKTKSNAAVFDRLEASQKGGTI